MNSRERLISVFRGELPDKVPVSLNVLNTAILRGNENLLHDLLEYTDPNIWVFMDRNFAGFEIIFGNNIYKNSKIIKEGNKTTIKVDTPKGELVQITENRDESDWIVKHFFTNISDLEKFYSFNYEPYEYIDISEYLFWDRFVLENGIASIVIYDAPCMLYLMMGPEKYYMSLMDDFETVKSFTAEAECRIEKYVRKIFEMISKKLLVFLIAGPEVFTRPMTSHYYYKELVFPYDRNLIKLIQELGGIANIHQHGMVRESLDTLIEMKPSLVSPFEAPPSGDMEIKEVKEKLAGKICVNGNLDDFMVLVKNNEKEIKIKVFELLRDVAPGGGFILGGTDSSILTDEILKNFILMGKICNLYGRYPINLDLIDERLKFLKK